jgi:transposase
VTTASLERRLVQLEKRLKQLERRDFAQRRELERLREENAELRRQVAGVRSLQERVERGQARIDALVKEVERLRRRERELEMRVGQDSETSSKPPSSDAPWEKEARRKDRNKRKAKKRGAKKGHEGRHRRRVASSEVDEVQEHRFAACEGCSAGLEEAPTRVQWRHQVVELVEVRARWIEHRGYQVKCPSCGRDHVSRRPSWLVRTGAFGPNLRALMTLLAASYRLSRRQVQRLLKQVWGVTVALGSVSNNESRVSDCLGGVYEDAHRRAQQSARANADETSWSLEDKLAWLWTVVTPDTVLYRIDRRRTREAAKKILGSFAGLLTTDRFSSYAYYDGGKRQFCWSHIDRDVEHLVRHVPEERVLLHKMTGLIAQMFRRHQRIRDGTVPWHRGWHKKIRRHFDACLVQGCASTHKAVRRLCRSLSKNPDALWRFARFEGVDPTNNAAERALRHAVIWRRISHGSRSERGARFVERMLTVVETLRVQGRDAWAYLSRLLHGSVHDAPLPSLSPDSMVG